MKHRKIDRFALLYGKTPLIVFAVLICSISFILGYFVGKSAHQPSGVVPEKEIIIHESKSPKPSKKGTSSVKEAKSTPVKPPVAEKKKATKKSEEPTLKERPFPIQRNSINYFTIQVGAFSSKKEAQTLKKRLSRKGYTVFINTSKRGKILYRVRVGRFIKRTDAEKVALKLKINEKLKTFIVTVNNSK